MNIKILCGTLNSLNLVGVPKENINVAEDGELIYLTADSCEVLGREGRSGRVFVDGKPENELEDIVLRDRIQLSEDGIVVPVILLHSDTATAPPLVPPASRGEIADGRGRETALRHSI